MDPKFPELTHRAWAEIQWIPNLVHSCKELEHFTYTEEVLASADDLEGAIGYCNCFSPVDPRTIQFGELHGGTIDVKVDGVIDFTYGGLGRFGKPDFKWAVKAALDLKKIKRKLRSPST